MLKWFCRRREAGRLAIADADAIRDDGGAASYKARHRERDEILPDGTTHPSRAPAHWSRVARIAARWTGHAIGLDTATLMLTGRDLPSPSEITGPDLAAEVERLLRLQFRVQFLDASGTIIREMYADAQDATDAIALVEGIEWPPRAVRMAILDADEREVHSQAL